MTKTENKFSIFVMACLLSLYYNCLKSFIREIHMIKQHFKLLKKFIATLLLATILSSSIAPYTNVIPDTIYTFSDEKRSETGRPPYI